MWTDRVIVSIQLAEIVGWSLHRGLATDDSAAQLLSVVPVDEGHPQFCSNRHHYNLTRVADLRFNRLSARRST
eukprot:6017089-Amphidinium_carterae.1